MLGGLEKSSLLLFQARLHKEVSKNLGGGKGTKPVLQTSLDKSQKASHDGDSPTCPDH